jgi:hypothetical protein
MKCKKKFSFSVFVSALTTAVPCSSSTCDVTVVFLFQGSLELKKRLEEVRLLESRKSARLMDQDTDFARLADMAGDRKRPSSHSIDVPTVQG